MSRLNLSRAQLGKFLNDFESIKQFEKLFSVADQVAPIVSDDSLTESGLALSVSNEALGEASDAMSEVIALSQLPKSEQVHNDQSDKQGGTEGEYYHLTSYEIANVRTITPTSITKEVTGFTDPANVIVTYDSTTRKITLTGTVAAYFQGTIVPELVTGWVSDSHDIATDHIYYLYYDGSAFYWNTDVYPGFDSLMISSVFYRAVNKFALRECHGMMPWQTHEELHFNIGTYRRSGGDISGTTIGSTTAADRRPDISECVIADEDLITTNPALTSKLYSQRYIVGVNTITYTLAAADIVPLLVANPYYNSYSAPNWGQTLMPANSVQSIWLYEVPVTADSGSQEIRHVFVQGQWITQATGAGAPAMAKALSDELLRTSSELDLGNVGLISNEYVAIKRIVIQYVGGNWSIAGEYALLGSRYTQVSAPSGGFISSVYANAPITGTGIVSDPIVIAAATTSVHGYLTSTDWNTFNGKQAALGFTPVNKAGDTGVGNISMGALTATTGSFSGSSFIGISTIGGLLAGDKYYKGMVVGNALASGQSVQFGYVYDTITPASSFSHITPYGGTEGNYFKMTSGSAYFGMATASTSTTTGTIIVTGGLGVSGDIYASTITAAHKSSDGTSGLTATKTFYAASSSGGSVNVLNTITIKNGLITAWTQA